MGEYICNVEKIRASNANNKILTWLSGKLFFNVIGKNT